MNTNGQAADIPVVAIIGELYTKLYISERQNEMLRARITELETLQQEVGSDQPN